MKTNIEILEDIIHSHKSSLFLRHSTATRKDVRALAELLHKEVVDPYMARRIAASIAAVTAKMEAQEREAHSNGDVAVKNYQLTLDFK